MTFIRSLSALALAAWMSVASAPFAIAETSEVRLAKQVGLGSLTLLVMEHEKLLEKHMQAEGIADPKAVWTTFGSGAVMNDGLISGNLDFAAGGAIPLAVLWSKTVGTPNEVRGVCGLNAMPMLLDTRNPEIKSIRDITPKSKIAVPAIKVSIQAVTLQMAAAKEWGDAEFAKLDPMTVSMNGVDSYVALTTGGGELDIRFGTAPYAQLELRKPGIHTILNSYDVLGGPHDINFIYTTKRFRDQNPKAYAAFVAAFKEATDIVNADKRRAAEIYLSLSPEKVSVDDLTAILRDPQFISSMTPMGVTKFVEFAYRTGTIKKKPETWKDLFFPEAQALPGG
ncbi:MAG: ABC transporter substrate-binding protein [Hyphomicrobiales bacterium]|nr:ABC transporter substrate-binding protein [Hyphomicrobiales bacterium]